MVRRSAWSARGVVAVALAGTATGCGSPPPCGLQVCDVRAPECQRRVSESAACMRQAPPVAVPVTVIARDEYIRRQTAVTLSLEEEAAFRAWNGGLALYGLAPPDLSPTQAAGANAGWVGAYYSRVAKAITIVDHGYPLESPYAVATLVHEYLHAMQDAAFDLGIVYERHALDRDRSLAVNAIIEGDATIVDDRALVGLFGDDPADIPWDRVFRDSTTRQGPAAGRQRTLSSQHPPANNNGSKVRSRRVDLKCWERPTTNTWTVSPAAGPRPMVTTHILWSPDPPVPPHFGPTRKYV